MNRIRELRESKGLQQKELAADLRVSQPTISAWEMGQKVPSAKSTLKLSKYFGVSVEHLLGADNAQQKNAREPQLVDDEDIKFALFDGAEDITDAQFEEVKRFAAYVRERDRK